MLPSTTLRSQKFTSLHPGRGDVREAYGVGAKLTA
jgi:hypothetical protein